MNYTEKYHLPQWEESDRVMRTDFNQMCADIESGLAAGAQGTEAAEELTFERLCRMAYNHYHHVRTLETMPRQMGVLHRGFEKNSQGVEGMDRRDGCCFMAMSEENFNNDSFHRGMVMTSQLKIVKGKSVQPLVVEFTAPGPGRIKRFFISGNFNDGDLSSTPARVELVNMDSGETEQSMMTELPFKTSGGATVETAQGFHFHGGCAYQLRVTPTTSAHCNAEGNLPGIATSTLRTEVFCFQYPEAETAYTFQESGESHGGIVLVRYNTYGEDARMSLLWDGEEIQPSRIRTVKENEITALEAEYRRNDLVPKDSHLELQMHCGINCELSLYSWGAVLL